MAERWTEERMQNALTAPGNLFDYRRYSVVPNVSWAVLEHGEADLVCLSKTGTFHEVEIKVCRSDIVADRRKSHHAHENRLISYTWFAVPEELAASALELVPGRFGIVVVKLSTTQSSRHNTHVVRRAKRWQQHNSEKPNEKEIIRFLRTGVIRMWSRRKAVAA